MSRIRLVKYLEDLVQIECGLDRLLVPRDVMAYNTEFVFDAFTLISRRLPNMLTLNIEIVDSKFGIVPAYFVLEYINHFLYHVLHIDLI